MYYVSKRMEIAGAHCLTLPYESKCENLHGHNWIVTVYCRSKTLTDYGMVIDFTHIKKEIHDVLDHHNINLVIIDRNPTAENMARWICDKVNDIIKVGECWKVTVQESEGNIAEYVREDE
jgi:6-pyruvoyltetrahydropterin/6-carboxytetrahydropterin synthase